MSVPAAPLAKLVHAISKVFAFIDFELKNYLANSVFMIFVGKQNLTPLGRDILYKSFAFPDYGSL